MTADPKDADRLAGYRVELVASNAIHVPRHWFEQACQLLESYANTIALLTQERDEDRRSAEVLEAEVARLKDDNANWIREGAKAVLARPQPSAADVERAREYIDIVFDGPPSHESGRFVEVESPPGTSISFGEWVRRDDGYWVLRFPSPTAALREERELRALDEAEKECLVDVLSHHNDFVTACEIARDNSTEESDRLYWKHQIDVLKRMADQAERTLRALATRDAAIRAQTGEE